MKINFFRNGFANNSSSTHSIIFTSDVGKDVDTEDYGWGNFLCSSKKTKASYMLCMLKQQLEECTDQSLHCAISEFLSGEALGKIFHDDDNILVTGEEYNDILEYVKETLPYYEIDHQSVFFFPHDHSDVFYDEERRVKKSCINMDFFYDFCKHIIFNSFVIVGGNDNDDEGNPSFPSIDNTPESFNRLLMFMQSTELSCIKDNDNWVIYDKYKGSEFCFSFNEGSKVASFPTLVDLKITDMCNHGCPHCYQGSTPKGFHADKRDLESIVYGLKRIGVGTVAIGGGNPLLYPGIYDLCKNISSQMTCCITLNSVKRSEYDLLAKILGVADSVAVTCNRSYEIPHVLAPYITMRSRAKIYVQGILEFFNTKEELDKYFSNIKLMCVNNVTLLGYKQVGRASKVAINPVSFDWIDSCKKSGLSIGIDACIAKMYKEDIDKAGVPSYLLCNEGDRSMYIDAVRNVANKDSYSDSSTEYHLNTKNYYGNSLTDAFNSFNNIFS